MIGVHRIDGSFKRWNELLALILASFSYMDDVIDPPSSAHLLNPDSLARKVENEIAFVAINDGALAGCVFLKVEPAALYVGKFAVAPALQGQGIGRRLLAVAEETALSLALPALRLETRIELLDTHKTFARWGFRKTAEKSHPGFTRTTFIEMRKDLA